MEWNAAGYSAFEAERNRPAADLIAGLGTAQRARVVDLGCGPGNSTELLAKRFPACRLSGVDSSESMLAAARARLPQVRFERRDVADWAAGPVDLIFANAVLHWVPGHIGQMARLLGELAPGGCLAAQMPDNAAEPSHVAMRDVAAEAPFADLLSGADQVRDEVGGFANYATALDPLVARLDMWRTVYALRLESVEAIVAMFESTGLRPYLAPLDPPMRALFLSRYRERIDKAYAALRGGGILMPFPRLFVVAHRG